jgi:hypothetical protein
MRCSKKWSSTMTSVTFSSNCLEKRPDPVLGSPAKKLPIPCKLSLNLPKLGWIKTLPPWVNSLLMRLELQLAVWLEFLRNSDDEVRRLVQQEAL